MVMKLSKWPIFFVFAALGFCYFIIQKYDLMLKWLQSSIVPKFICPKMVRVGAIGDGGKWVCDPWKAPKHCVIYSFGVSGDVSFENHIHQITESRCEIYSFDPAPQPLELFAQFNGHFEQWAVAAFSDNSNNRTIADIAKHFKHTKIEFVKMDIEGDEYSVLPEFFKSANVTELASVTCQLFVELHYDGNSLEPWKRLIQLLDEKGFLMFSKEENPKCSWCYEYSYIHRTCLKNYNIA